MEPTEGFEPTTRCLQNSRSGQLSYVGITISAKQPANTYKILLNFICFFKLYRRQGRAPSPVVVYVVLSCGYVIAA